MESNYIIAFNNLLLKFNQEIIELFPEETDFKLYKTALNLIITTDKYKLSKLFKTYIIQYKQNILDKNEIFFLNNEYKEITKKTEGIQLIIDKIKKYWSILSNNNKEQIWTYLHSLIKLNDMII